jgi:hypothetical protein
VGLSTSLSYDVFNITEDFVDGVRNRGIRTVNDLATAPKALVSCQCQ